METLSWNYLELLLYILKKLDLDKAVEALETFLHSKIPCLKSTYKQKLLIQQLEWLISLTLNMSQAASRTPKVWKHFSLGSPNNYRNKWSFTVLLWYLSLRADDSFCSQQTALALLTWQAQVIYSWLFHDW